MDLYIKRKRHKAKEKEGAIEGKRDRQVEWRERDAEVME
jgi:hypothetical protein